MMLFSTGVAVSAIIVACGLWIESGWNDGAGAVTLAAVACCFFAALDEPAPQVFTFFLATCLSVVLAGLYVFAVLPKVHDFPMLVLIFAVPFLIIGTLIPRPRFTLVTMLTAVNTATFISIQSAYEANFFVFINSNLAGVAGLLFAFIWTRMTRPFGAELAAARLTRSAWADIVVSASPTVVIEDQRDLYARMLDRLMQLLPRHAATDSHRHPSIESFRDFRVALNALDLRRTRRKLPAELQTSIDSSARCVAPLLRALHRAARASAGACRAHSRHRCDERAGHVTRDHAVAGAHRVAAEHWLRETLHALVGMRLSLHPPATQTQPDAATGAPPREEPA